MSESAEMDGQLSENRLYREQRRAYYARFPTFWATLPGEKTEEYAMYGALEMSREHASQLRTAATRLYRLLARLAGVLQRADDQTLLDIGIPLSALPYAHLIIPDMPAVMCGRFEFAMTTAGPKLLEFNAETPTFVVELFQMNGQVCADFGLVDPNAHCRAQLATALRVAIAAGLNWLKPRPKEPASVVFSAYAVNKEERGTTEFYRDLAEMQKDTRYHTAFHDLEALRIARDKVYTANGERVDVLYKLYPTEYLIEDEAPDGTPVGLALLDLVRRRKLAIVNPPSAFVLQNKALMALLWSSHLLHSDLFSLQEHEWIEQYVLPTYLDATDAQGHTLFNGSYVVKPVYGREGVSITLRNGNEVLEQSEQDQYNDQVMIYQQYTPLPTTMLQTENGLHEVSLVHNCFVVAGEPSAVGVRASHKLIFDDSSYFVPVCYPPEPRLSFLI